MTLKEKINWKRVREKKLLHFGLKWRERHISRSQFSSKVQSGLNDLIYRFYIARNNFLGPRIGHQNLDIVLDDPNLGLVEHFEKEL